MKKKVLAIIIIIAIAFAVIILNKEKITANETLEIVDIQYIQYQYENQYHTGMLYDNNQLYLWGENTGDSTIENVKDFSISSLEEYSPIILYTDGTLKRSIYDSEYTYENVKEFIHIDEYAYDNEVGEVTDILAYINNNNE